MSAGPKIPRYGRKKVDEIMKTISDVAEQVAVQDVDGVRLHLSKEQFLILNDMLKEMDRHLPDFFEEEASDER
jgi:hypothetical protein